MRPYTTVVYEHGATDSMVDPGKGAEMGAFTNRTSGRALLSGTFATQSGTMELYGKLSAKHDVMYTNTKFATLPEENKYVVGVVLLLTSVKEIEDTEMYLCYCNHYADLQKAFCGGGVCNTQNERGAVQVDPGLTPG